MGKQTISQAFIVTGGAGFIGSCLALELLDQGISADKLLLVDDPKAFESRKCCSKLRERGISLIDANDFLNSLSDYQDARVIFHMGASSSTEEMRKDFLQKVNTDYTQHLWNHCTENKIPFYYASSAATYGDGKNGFDDSPENFRNLKPLNPYGQSKLDFDIKTLDLIKENKTPTSWAGFRFFNVYGHNEEHKGSQSSVLWIAKKQLEESGEVKLFKSHNPDYKDGQQLRDFVWIGDVTRTLISFWKNSYKNGIYNLGTGQARSFIDLAKAVATALNKEAKISFFPTPERLREHYQYYTQANLYRLRQSGYDFTPTSLEEGIAKSIKAINKNV